VAGCEVSQNYYGQRELPKDTPLLDRGNYTQILINYLGSLMWINVLRHELK